MSENVKDIKKMGLFELILNIDYIIAGLSLATLVVVTFLGVIMRYFVKDPIIWQEEVQLWCMVWIVFIGASMAVRNGSHIAIDIIIDLLPPKIKMITEYFGYIVTICILLYLAYQGNSLIGQLIRTERVTNILRVPYSVIYSVMPIGCVLMIINQIFYIIKQIKENK